MPLREGRRRRTISDSNSRFCAGMAHPARMISGHPILLCLTKRNWSKKNSTANAMEDEWKKEWIAIISFQNWTSVPVVISLFVYSNRKHWSVLYIWPAWKENALTADRFFSSAFDRLLLWLFVCPLFANLCWDKWTLIGPTKVRMFMLMKKYNLTVIICEINRPQCVRFLFPFYIVQ